MSYTITSPSGKRLNEKLSPWTSEDLERYLQSIGKAIFDPVEEISTETGTQGHSGWVPGYGIIFNPATCPAKFLPWLGMFVGVEVPKTATEAEARELVKNEAGLARGTTGAIEAAIKRVLGTEPFAIQERTAANGTEAAYHFNVIVGTGLATAALSKAIEEVKPGGVMFSVIEGKGMWLQATKKWSEVGAGKTWPEAEGNT